MQRKRRSMMNRLAAVAMSILMAVCVLGVSGTSVWAEDFTPVAEINGDEFGSLEEAIDAIEESGTVKLLADIAFDNDGVEITEGKDITLDLNGKALTGVMLDVYGTLTVTDSATGGSITGADHAIFVNPGADLAISDGTISSGGGVAIWVEHGTATISGGTVQKLGKYRERCHMAIRVEGGTLYVQSGAKILADVEDSKVQAIGLYSENGDDSVCEISGGTVSGYGYGVSVFQTSELTVKDNAVIEATEGFAIATNGNEGNDVTINIEGGEITGSRLGVFLPSGLLNITGGSISGATGIYQKAGLAVISNGKISGTGEKMPYVYTGNGANPTGDAIVVESCNYPDGTPELTVNGNPQIVSTNGAGIADYVRQSDNPDILCSDPYIQSMDNTISLLPGRVWGNEVDKLYRLVKVTGWQKLNGQWFYFNNGEMKTGWIEEGDKKYYTNEDGVMQTGWQKIEGEWYFFRTGDSGLMLTETWAKDSTDWYYMGADGKITKNAWAKDSKGWCYLDADGKITKNKWIQYKGEWYYLKSNGYMAANEWAKDSVNWYWMGSDGKIAKNVWAKDSKGWCWMGSDGTITKNKWIQYNGGWYYLKSNGYMAANEYVNDSKGRCWMTASGKWDGRYR